MKNITPSIIGCGGIFVLIGLILLLFFKDEVGGNIMIVGLVIIALILISFVLSYVYKKFKN